jgi:hypothetical protein
MIPPFVGTSKDNNQVYTLRSELCIFFKSNERKNHSDLSVSSSASLRKFDYWNLIKQKPDVRNSAPLIYAHSTWLSFHSLTIWSEVNTIKKSLYLNRLLQLVVMTVVRWPGNLFEVPLWRSCPFACPDERSGTRRFLLGQLRSSHQDQNKTTDTLIMPKGTRRRQSKTYT